MSAITSLEAVGQWEDLWGQLASGQAPTSLVFKRSPTCPISRAAEGAFEEFAAGLAHDAPPRLYRVDVVNAREISRQIASDTGVKHESPQALLLGPGQRVLWNASHHAIDGTSLAEAAARAR